MPMITSVFAVTTCIAQIAVAKLSLFALGFGRTLAWYEGTACPARSDVTADDRIIERVAHRVAVAAALYPGRARCLEQSLILSRALRRLGVDAKVRFGVHPYPFTAHSWVEAHGYAVNEMEDYLTMFTPLEG